MTDERFKEETAQRWDEKLQARLQLEKAVALQRNSSQQPCC